MITMFSAQRANAGLDLAEAVARVLDRHWYVLGEEVSGFEAEFAQAVGVAHCVGVGNGTDAIELALRALGVKSGDRVCTVANAGFYSTTAILAIGAIPLFVDIDPQTMTMSPDALTTVIDQRPVAVIVTHLYGQLGDMTSLAAICTQAGIPLIEDCAQAHGAQRGHRQAGGFADIACFSFYPTKNLGALGDGGAVVTQNEATAQRLRALRQYGWQGKYHVEIQGGRNTRLDEIQAAVLRVKLPYLASWNETRRQIANRYSSGFADLPVTTPGCLGPDHVAHLYVLRVRNRDSLRAYLQSCGIATDVHYPVPDHWQKAYRTLDLDVPSLPITETAAAQLISLPCYPGLPDKEVDQVIAAVCTFFSATDLS